MDNTETYILNEGVSDVLGDLWEGFKSFFEGMKNLASNISDKLKLPEIGQSILAFLKTLPIVNKFFKNQFDSEESRVKAIIGDISIGNGVSIIMNLTQRLTSFVWYWLPGESMKQGLLKIWGYNEKKTFYQTLYKMMIQAEIPQTYANAYLIIQVMRMPIYIMLYNWKSLFWDGSSNPTEEDKLHPFTAGDPITNKETGLNEAEQKILGKVQRFIQIKKMSQYSDRGPTDFEVRQKLAKSIRNEAIFAFIPIIFRSYFLLFRYGLGIKETSFLGHITSPIDYTLRFIFSVYLYYFLITGVVLASCGIDDEEKFNPTNPEDDSNIDDLSFLTSDEEEAEIVSSGRGSTDTLIKFNETVYEY